MSLFVFVLFLLSVISVAVSIFLFNRHNIPGVKPFIACLMLVAIWNSMDAVDLLLHNLDDKVIWFEIKMAFIVYIPSLWLMTILEVTNIRKFKSFANASLAIFPTITAIIVLTSHYNNWFAYSFYLESVDKYKILRFNKGVWFWVNASYNYLLNAISLGFLLKAAFSKQYARKRQAIIMIIGMLIPIISDIMFIGNIYHNLDIISISFWISLVVSIYGILKYGFMNISLVARECVFEDMDELMIVLDVNKRVVDMNKRALQVLNIDISNVIGRPISQVVNDIDNYDFCDLKESALKIRFNYKVYEKEINYYGSISAIKGNRNYIIGYLLLLYDTTELTITQNKLKQANDELRRLNQELYYDSIRDGLTKVYNKKYITVLLQEEIKKAIENTIPLTIAIIDIDHFKKFNDNYGHLIGDNVLEKVAELITVELGSRGKVGRFGGEEFLILMPDTELRIGYEICEKIRCKIASYKFQYECGSVTISGGMTELRYCDNINSLIKRADDSLYKAKDVGRNKIEIAEVTV